MPFLDHHNEAWCPGSLGRVRPGSSAAAGGGEAVRAHENMKLYRSIQSHQMWGDSGASNPELVAKMAVAGERYGGPFYSSLRQYPGEAQKGPTRQSEDSMSSAAAGLREEACGGSAGGIGQHRGPRGSVGRTGP